ncbi:hypothetical protein RDI58_016336 [Solanum bulbocastanum]|uniref:Uncharacterized protein n=1 Tax=Solanum bulbocastanum TaxID=147425 RepID=A0AAN8YDN3_SOLBU
MTASEVTMKLLIDSKSKKVMFAEAGKECIDFLFQILALQIGSVIRLLTTKGMIGCLGNLYVSLQNLDNVYIQPNQKKDTLLKPKSAASVPLLLINNSPVQKQFYRCPNHKNVVASNVGLVKGVVTYMVLDDLVMKPCPLFQVSLCSTNSVLRMLVFSKRKLLVWEWMRL